MNICTYTINHILDVLGLSETEYLKKLNEIYTQLEDLPNCPVISGELLKEIREQTEYSLMQNPYGKSPEELGLDIYGQDYHRRTRLVLGSWLNRSTGQPLLVSTELYNGDTSPVEADIISAFMNHDDVFCKGGYVYGEHGFVCYYRTKAWDSPEAARLREALTLGRLDKKPMFEAFNQFYSKICDYQFKDNGVPL